MAGLRSDGIAETGPTLVANNLSSEANMWQVLIELGVVFAARMIVLTYLVMRQ